MTNQPINDGGPAFPSEEQIRCNGEVCDARKRGRASDPPLRERRWPMSELAKKIDQQGTGVYQMTRKEAGEAYRAAKKVKAYQITYWNRKKKEAK